MTYTEKQLAEFAKFCQSHNLQFNTIAEYNGAIFAYFEDDNETF